MNTVKRLGTVKVRLVSGLCMAGNVLVFCSPFPCVAINAVGSGTAAVQSGAPPVRYSAGVADVLKLADARVDPSVIQVYVKEL